MLGCRPAPSDVAFVAVAVAVAVNEQVDDNDNDNAYVDDNDHAFRTVPLKTLPEHRSVL